MSANLKVRGEVLILIPGWKFSWFGGRATDLESGDPGLNPGRVAWAYASNLLFLSSGLPPVK